MQKFLRSISEHPLKRVLKGIAFSGSLFVCCYGFSATADAPPKTHDGLNLAEQQRALRTLQQETQPQRLKPQLLLMERRHVKGAAQRLADAWYYDYTYNETTHQIIDVANGDVIASEVVIGTQLPLVDAEITRAFDVLLGSEPDLAALERAYRQVTGEAFRDRTQVSYKAFVFHPSTVTDGLSAAAKRCGINRCAQMLIYTHDNVALDTSPIVDLSTSKVLQNLELRAQTIVRREEAAR